MFEINVLGEYKYLFLVNLKRGYHLFPLCSMLQNINMAAYTPHMSLNGILVLQKDGSRFAYLDRQIDPLSMISEIRSKIPLGLDIIPEIKGFKSADDIIGIIKKFEDDIKEYKLVFYYTHQFLNGSRGLVMLINPEKKRCFNLTRFYRPIGLIAEDGLGILIESLEEVVTDDIKKIFNAFKYKGLSGGEFCDKDIVVIDYRSSVRLCPTCGVVSDISKPVKNPWMAYYDRKGLEGFHKLNVSRNFNKKELIEMILERFEEFDKIDSCACAYILSEVSDYVKKTRAATKARFAGAPKRRYKKGLVFEDIGKYDYMDRGLLYSKEQDGELLDGHTKGTSMGYIKERNTKGANSKTILNVSDGVILGVKRASEKKDSVEIVPVRSKEEIDKEKALREAEHDRLERLGYFSGGTKRRKKVLKLKGVKRQ